MLAMAVLAVMSTSQAVVNQSGEGGFQLKEETPDVFLAKATLQQYLSRVVRKDWDGARRLTHPKTLQALTMPRRGRFFAGHGLSPWTADEVQLKTFRFVEARQVAPGVVVIQVGEDNLHRGAGTMSSDDASVYVLFKSRGAFLVGDRRPSAELAEVTDESVRGNFPGYVDAQVQAQARRDSGLHEGRHR
jgi:hypothetical protein